ncbi:MAG TPA: hypothetical protein VKA84_21130 [Gemmatimonadaceae bacterium]|nr:hypothetical protein [Gemmatimonadaceae bacterium]
MSMLKQFSLVVECTMCDFTRETSEFASVRATLGQARRHARTEGHSVRCVSTRITMAEPPARAHGRPIDAGTRRRAAKDLAISAAAAQLMASR